MWPEAAEIQQQSVISQVLKWPRLLLFLFNQWSQFPPAYWYFQLLFRQPSGSAPSQVCLTCLVMRGLSEMPWSHSWPQDIAFQSSKYFSEDLVHNTVFNTPVQPVHPLSLLPLAVWEKKKKSANSFVQHFSCKCRSISVQIVMVKNVRSVVEIEFGIIAWRVRVWGREVRCCWRLTCFEQNRYKGFQLSPLRLRGTA